MDILADQLAQARARGALFSVLRRIRPWGLRFGGQRPLTAHCLVEGEGWLEQPGREPVRLRERDMVLMTAGPPYAIVSDLGTAVLWGHDAAAQAEQIISKVAHPEARDELRSTGHEMGLLPG